MNTCRFKFGVVKGTHMELKVNLMLSSSGPCDMCLRKYSCCSLDETYDKSFNVSIDDLTELMLDDSVVIFALTEEKSFISTVGFLLDSSDHIELDTL